MKSKLLIIACLIIVLSMALILPLSIVNADYSDIQNNSSAIVNFNQQVVNTYTHGSFGSSQAINFANNIIVGHHIYIRFNVIEIGSSANALYFGSSANSYNQLVGVINANTPRTIDTIVVAQYSYLNTYMNSSMSWNIMAIDLDLMFGSDNIPSLLECQELFVSDYYSYDSGSAVSLDGLNSYAQGVNSVYSSLVYTYNTNYILNNLKPYTYPNSYGIESSVIDLGSYSFQIKSGVYIPFNTTLDSNSVINLNMRLAVSTPSGGGMFNFNVWYVYFYLEDGSLEFFSSLDAPYTSVDDDYLYTLSMVSNNRVSGIVITDRNDRSDHYLSMFYPTITIQANDVSILIYNASTMVEEKYSNYYGVNGQGYHDIFEAGRIAGINQENPYTFGALMSSVIESPIQAVLEMFNFDFLGYNFKNVITLIITLCIILAIIRLFIGMGASE